MRKKTRGRPATFDRAAALDVATKLFWRHGFEGTTVAMLTEALGVTPPTLYAAFGSKDLLYREALGNYGRLREAAVEVTVPTARDAVERFLRDIALRFTAADGPKGCMVATGMLRSGVDGVAAADATADMRRAGLKRFVALLEGARAAGELPADADVEALARFYSAVLQGMSVQAIDGADCETLDRVIDQALQAWPRP